MAIEITQEIIDTISNRAFLVANTLQGFEADIIVLEKTNKVTTIRIGNYEYDGLYVLNSHIIKIEDLSFSVDELEELRKKAKEEQEKIWERNTRINAEKDKYNKYIYFLNLKLEYSEITEAEYALLSNEAEKSLIEIVEKINISYSL